MPDIGANNFRFKGVAKEKVAAAFRAALTDVGFEIRADLREITGVPVDYSTRPPTRSRPGRPPRKDSGDFNKSFRFRTSAEGVGANKELIVVWSIDRKVEWLEKGNKWFFARPSIGPTRAKWGNKLKRVIREKMAERLK